MGRYRLMTLFRPVVACSAALAFGAAPAAADAATRLVVRGGGFGHGVGMSQYGALGQAQQGRSYREILGHYYTDTQLGRLDADPVVRVLLQSGKRTIWFAGAAQAGDRALQPGKTYRATAFGGTGVVLRSASGRKLKTFPAPLRIVGSGDAPVRLSGAGAYRGALELRPSAFGGLNAINAIGLESYVRGVVSAESPSSWPAEALKAQAVAARTYAITTSKSGAGFDHYADTRSQMYRGVAAETPSTDAAVAATNGEVVTYQGKPVVTYFFSTSGGRTENAEFGFPGGEPKPWLKSVDDPYDSVSPRHRWGPMRYTVTQASAKLRGLVKGRFRSIEVTRRGVSPRIVSADIVGSKGRTTVSGPTLRSRFRLFDTWAYFTTVGTQVDPAQPPADPTPGTGSETGPGTGTAGAYAATPRERGTIHGRIGGVKPGTTILVRRRSGGRWVTVARARTGRHGHYRASLTRSGLYRVRVDGVDGDAVRLK
jgi:stage II sporulation protein D